MVVLVALLRSITLPAGANVDCYEHRKTLGFRPVAPKLSLRLVTFRWRHKRETACPQPARLKFKPSSTLVKRVESKMMYQT